jgi:hypothetical protein
MKNPTHTVSSPTPNSSPKPIAGYWRRFLVAGLTLGLAAVIQTVHASPPSMLVYSNNFNNASNNLANNDLGIGAGFNSYSRANGIDTYEATNYAFISTSYATFNQAELASGSSIDISGAGTTFDFSGVNFSPNLNNAQTGNTQDELYFGVSLNNAVYSQYQWFANGAQGMPAGFYIQPMSDSIPNTGTGQTAGGWNGNSILFYKGPGTNLVKLATWKFQNLTWSSVVGSVSNYAPVLDVQLTLSATGWALNITGDVNSNSLPISFSGNYADTYISGGVTNNGITNALLNGLNQTYVAAYTSAATPAITMGFDKVTATQLGTLAVTTPRFSTPQLPYTTNVDYAGDTMILSSVVTDTAGTPTLQWQLENVAVPGTFTNLPSGNAQSVNINTAGFPDGLTRGVRLIATDGALSVTSAVVKMTTLAPTAPILLTDIEAANNVVSAYVGQGLAFSQASFYGNQPITYQWKWSDDASTWNDVLNATNATLSIPSIAPTDSHYYMLEAQNAFGSTDSSFNYILVQSGTPQYLWSTAVPFGGLNADQILTNFPSNYKIAGAMYATNGGLPVVVSTGTGQNITFGAAGLSFANVTNGNGWGVGANTNQTGNANFDNVLNYFAFDTPVALRSHYITMSGLIVGKQYQVQLFALDDRIYTNNIGKRLVNYQDPADLQDVSLAYRMGDNVYILGTFTASNTVQTIQQNMLTTNLGNFNALVLRTVGWNPPPYFVYQPQNQGNFVGKTVTLLSLAAADPTTPSPTISYRWKSGQPGGPYTDLVEGAKYNGTTTSTLTVSNLAFADGGTNLVYVVAVTNGSGGLYSREAFIYPQGAPAGIVDGSYAAYAKSNNPAGLWMLMETNDPATGALLAYDSSGNEKNGLYGSAAQDGYNGILGPQPFATNGLFPYPGFATNGAALKTTIGTARGYINLPNLNFTNLETSYVLWINPIDNGGYARGLLYARNTGNGTGNGTDQIGGFGYGNGVTSIGYNWNDNANTYVWNSGLVPVIGTWNMVALIITKANATVYQYYLNPAGQAVLLKAVNNVPNTSVVRYSGGYIMLADDPYDLANRVFNGSVAGAAIFNHEVTEKQLQAMFVAGTGIGAAGFPPAFVTQPSTNTLTFPGKTIQISATVSSATTPVTNQWTLNSTNLTDGYYDGVLIKGSTSNVLTIAGITTNWAGVYNLIVGNQVATITSSNALVTLSALVAPSDSNIVGHWLSGAANLKDSSGYTPAGTHDGYTVGNSSYYFTNDVPAGYSGQAIVFNNTGLMITNSSTNDLNYVNTYDAPLYTNQFTVMCWAKGTPGGWNAYMSKQGETQGWQLRVENSGPPRPSFNICNGGINAGSAQSTTAWHHYAATWNATNNNTRQLYVDGNLIGTATGGTYTPQSGDHVMISGRQDTTRSGGYGLGNYFNGEMYDARIYNVALTAAQINYLVPPTPVVVPIPTLTKQYIPGNPGQFVVSWNTGRLLVATNVAGPWVTNAVQTSPLTNAITSTNTFYKVVNP